MDKITQVLFSDIGKVITQYVELPHQNLNRKKSALLRCFTEYVALICMY